MANVIDIDGIPIYHKMIIADYLKFIDLLAQIERLTVIQENEDFDWYGKSFEALNGIRLGDFYIKKKCENMSFKILKIIKEECDNYSENSISISSSIVNSTYGEFRFYYKINERITISIEVSGMYYRKMVHLNNQKKDGVIEPGNSNLVQEVTDYFKNEINWFDFSQITKINPKYKSRKTDGINGFWDTSRYSQCLLNNTNTTTDIISYFVNDFNFILKNKDLITNNNICSPNPPVV